MHAGGGHYKKITASLQRASHAHMGVACACAGDALHAKSLAKVRWSSSVLLPSVCASQSSRAQVQAACKELGRPVSGTHAELCSRLLGYETIDNPRAAGRFGAGEGGRPRSLQLCLRLNAWQGRGGRRLCSGRRTPCTCAALQGPMNS